MNIMEISKKDDHYLRESIFLMILDLHNGDKVHANIVNQVGRVLCQVEYHEIEIKSNHTDERKCKSSSECEPFLIRILAHHVQDYKGLNLIRIHPQT